MQRTIYFDYLRVIACFAVIILHVSALQYSAYVESPFEWSVINVYDSATRFCVPIFIMISGALFLDPARKISLMRLYTHNILRIVTSFLFWSFIYACYVYTPNEAPSFITLFLWGHVHMWFLWLIVGLYMLIPVLRTIAQNRLVMKYFLFLSVTLGFVIPFVFEFIRSFIPSLSQIVVMGEMCYEKLHIQLFSGYTSYFVLGYYLHSTQINRKKENIFLVLGMFAGISIAVLTYMLFNKIGPVDEAFDNYDTLLVLLETVAVFLFVKRFANRESKIVLSLSQHSFGIYLIHMLVYYMLGPNTLTVNLIMGIPLVSIWVLVASYVIILCLSRIPVVNRWLI